MTFIRNTIVLVSVLGLGCADSTAPAAHLSGTWTHDYSIPGMGFQMTLAAQGNAVSGTGTWAGEACCAGTVSVTGTLTDGTLELDLTETTTSGVAIPAASTSHFEGILLANVLSGTLSQNGQSTPYSYRRVP